jgi:hypothetical protein
MSTEVSEVRAASIIRAIVRTSEMSVDIQVRTRQYIPEDSELHTHSRENFKSHIVLWVFNAGLYLFLAGD